MAPLVGSGCRSVLSYSSVKSACDVTLAFLLLLLLAPLLLVVGLVVFCVHGAPVLFVQKRAGFRGRPFFLFKFRSMTNQRDLHGGLLSDAARLTPFGLWLRSTSMDELPGLVNILCGQMSFVGPRPLLIEYLPLYSSEQSRRHDVKPGFGGLAQINGRNTLSWEEKFRLDVFYVDHQNFWLDLRILMITVWKVIRREGISAVGEATMTPFVGSGAPFVSR